MSKVDYLIDTLANYLIADLEFQVVQLIIKNKIPTRNQMEMGSKIDAYPNRNIFKEALKKNIIPSKNFRDRLAFNLLDNYCAIPLPHDHDENGWIKLETLPHEWMRKTASLLSNNIEGAWAKLHKDDDNK